jgi:hypothetical protein
LLCTHHLPDISNVCIQRSHTLFTSLVPRSFALMYAHPSPARCQVRIRDQSKGSYAYSALEIDAICSHREFEIPPKSRLQGITIDRVPVPALKSDSDIGDVVAFIKEFRRASGHIVGKHVPRPAASAAVGAGGGAGGAGISAQASISAKHKGSQQAPLSAPVVTTSLSPTHSHVCVASGVFWWSVRLCVW